MKKIIIFCLSILIPAIIPIIWDKVNSDHKELTIEECKKTPIDNLYGKKFTVYYLDSIKVDNKYSIIEYRIINTGNTTIFGYGDWSDILTESNRLPIISAQSDLKFIQLTNNNIAKLDNQNRLIFKQWKPKEYIDIVCLAANDDIINISDRDIKDVRIIYKKPNKKRTNFEELSMTTKWVQVAGYLLDLILIIIYIILDIKQSINYVAERHRKRIAIYLTICFIFLLYTFSLPLRWLL